MVKTTLTPITPASAIFNSISRSNKSIEAKFKPSRNSKRNLMVAKPTYLEFSFDDMI